MAEKRRGAVLEDRSPAVLWPEQRMGGAVGEAGRGEVRALAQVSHKGREVGDTVRAWPQWKGKGSRVSR